jgi:Domain of unknown function (DUF4253)
MTANTTNDPFAAIRQAETSAPNFDLDNAEIIDHLKQWQSLCSFVVKEAEGDRIEIEFTALPKDMDAFARDLYDFCPDVVDQGTGCVHEMLESMEEIGEEIDPDMAKLIEGVDFNDENYGLEILKRQVAQNKAISLWWD